MPAISKQTPWQIQCSVVFTVFLRELKSRFGRYNLGYLWALAEPIFIVIVMSLIRGLLTKSNMAGLPPILFFASGFLTFSLFRNIITASISAIESNMGLFNYQRVKPMDIVVARWLLETIITFFVMILILGSFYLSGMSFSWNSTLRVMGAFGCLFMLGGGIGLICCIVGPLWQDAKKIIPMLIRPFFFISGIFFAGNAVPRGMRDYVMWNPLLHLLELVRESMFVEYTSHEGNWGYLFGVSIVTFLIGLVVYRLSRKTVLTSGYIR